ncbi:PH domain-containing protein [Myroides sp. M-43]|uniref:PH domain-containing protein n=1 Tax=Myroides TaxID=76831 RepID=UPI000EFD429E|nr:MULTISPECIES: PH domain-containing protein [Myroides]MCC9042523.1 PH domain-containing protein [Myroides oncorhynchi]
MRFSYYNLTSKILLSVFCLLPFLGMIIFFMQVGNVLAISLSVIMIFLLIVFIYKCFFIKVNIDKSGITYVSPLKNKHLNWDEVKDVLIVVRERRSLPDYYKFNEWMEAGKAGKSYFVLFRTTEGFPENPMFMFSAPTGEDYISVQFRPSIKQAIEKYR